MYRTRPKTEKGRRAIPLPEALADQLLAYIERHGVNGDGSCSTTTRDCP